MKTEIIGESTAVKSMIKLIKKVAPSHTNLLVTGESGTGKELVARMIHEESPLSKKNFVPVNCGAIPENLIESELFGHKKGSFTGAVSDKKGLFQVADGGTLFLDEIGELPLGMQVKLLRALQEQTIRQVGGVEDIKVRVRIIAATNRDLEEEISLGRFREDLYYRLNVISIQTPPLRDRENDTRILAEYFLKKMAKKYNNKVTDFQPEALEAIEGYRWPGNVRELENAIERALTLETESSIQFIHLPSAVRNSVSQVKWSSQSLPSKEAPTKIEIPAPDFSNGFIDLDKILGEIEKTYLEAALDHTHGVKKKAAEILGITFRSMRYRLKKLGVEDTPDSE
ncbi:MAG: Fis family transcriptional regulator [Bdellovibrionaceae bacterium]|nr:Fis family transcriptional regulator [Pseudobdellovibrionaceae bacterium]